MSAPPPDRAATDPPATTGPGPRLGLRVFWAMGLVVIAGAVTMILVALLLAPAVFTWHLNQVGIQQTPDAAQHVRDGFAQATLVATTVGVLAALLVAAAVAAFVARRISRPITAIAETTTRLASGDYADRVGPPRLGPELADLTHSVNALAGRLETAEQTRIRLMADLAHEMRTPVASIEATIEAIVDGVLPVDTETRDTLTGQAQRLSRLTDDLAAVSRAEERSFRLAPTTLDLAEVAHACAAAASARFTQAGIDLIAPPGPGPLVHADRDRLVEVIDQLLANALNHCQYGDRVTMTTTSPHTAAGELAITDTGSGFNQDDAERLFDRFYRADPTRARQSGSGIGLTIARALVNAQGGTLTANSAGPQQGATFTVTLPAPGHASSSRSRV